MAGISLSLARSPEAPKITIARDGAVVGIISRSFRMRGWPRNTREQTIGQLASDLAFLRRRLGGHFAADDVVPAKLLPQRRAKSRREILRVARFKPREQA